MEAERRDNFKRAAEAAETDARLHRLVAEKAAEANQGSGVPEWGIEDIYREAAFHARINFSTHIREFAAVPYRIKSLPPGDAGAARGLAESLETAAADLERMARGGRGAVERIRTSVLLIRNQTLSIR